MISPKNEFVHPPAGKIGDEKLPLIANMSLNAMHAIDQGQN